jgi:hypothetical protein
MTKTQLKLISAYDALATQQGRINVHEVVQDAMRDINYSWATYQRYSKALLSLLGSTFEPAPAQQQERDVEIEWHNTIIIKAGA